MTWHEFVAAVEADGITGETTLASVRWTAREGLMVQAQPTSEPSEEGDLAGGTVLEPAPEAPPQCVYTKHNELGEVEIHD